MELSPHGREFYQFTATTSPIIPGPWEASFDNGKTWFEGEVHPTETDGWRWLVCGAKAEVIPGVVAVIPRSLTPDVRAVDSPEIVARKQDVPPINYLSA